MYLCEEACKLIMKHDGMKLLQVLKKMITNKVTIKLNIFDSFMKDVIMGNFNNAYVVVV